MHVHYNHEKGDRVQVEAIPQAGDAYYNGLTGTVIGHEPDWDDDRTWPIVVVQLDGMDKPARILDYNLKGA